MNEETIHSFKFLMPQRWNVVATPLGQMYNWMDCQDVRGIYPPVSQVYPFCALKALMSLSFAALQAGASGAQIFLAQHCGMHVP